MTMVYTFNREKIMSKEPDEDLIDKLSPYPQSRYVYRWNNGRIGAIFPSSDGHVLDFREYELYDGPDNNLSYPSGLRPVKEGDEDFAECKELLASGIVAYYLHMRNKKNPKDIFADYLKYEKEVFQILCDADMRAWDPKYKKNFSYSEHFKQEKRRIKMSSRIFDFLGKGVVTEINNMAVNYLRFVKSQIKNYSYRELTRDEERDCFKKAVLRVMYLKNNQGDYIFRNPHWIAVYWYAVDFCLLTENVVFNDKGDLEGPENPDTAQYKAFKLYIKELQLDQESTARIPFRHDIDFSKSSYKPYRTSYPWAKEGLDGKALTLYNEMEGIYLKLNEEFRDIENDISHNLT